MEDASVTSRIALGPFQTTATSSSEKCTRALPSKQAIGAASESISAVENVLSPERISCPVTASPPQIRRPNRVAELNQLPRCKLPISLTSSRHVQLDRPAVGSLSPLRLSSSDADVKNTSEPSLIVPERCAYAVSLSASVRRQSQRHRAILSGRIIKARTGQAAFSSLLMSIS